MRNELYHILEGLQELLYETDAVKTASDLMCESLREKEEALGEKLLHVVNMELVRLQKLEEGLIEQMDVFILEERKKEQELA